MDENKVYTEAGIVNISDDVVQTIAAMAINEVNGVTLPTGIADGLVEKDQVHFCLQIQQAAQLRH